MYDDEILYDAWKSYQEVLDSRDNKDYILNFSQMKKLKEAYAFLSEFAIENGGKVEVSKPEPKELHGGLTIYCPIFCFSGEELKKLDEIIQSSSAMSIDTMANGSVCVSFTIPDIYSHI